MLASTRFPSTSDGFACSHINAHRCLLRQRRASLSALVVGQVIVDLSRAAGIADMRPNRAGMMSFVLQNFVREFFDQNPLSHMGVIALRNGLAERLTELSGSPVTSQDKTLSPKP